MPRVGPRWQMPGVRVMGDLLRWRDSRNEPPNEPGNYLVITNEFYGGQSVEVLYWNGGWPLGTFRYRVEYWRPIGPLPGEGGSDE